MYQTHGELLLNQGYVFCMKSLDMNTKSEASLRVKSVGNTSPPWFRM